MSAIVTRGGKGAPLTQGEMDANFVNLNTDKVETASNSGASGASVFKAKSSNDLAFRKIVAGTNVTVTELTNSVVIDASGGTPTPTAVSDQTNTSTGYFDLPSGTTAQRPVSPPIGATRFNSTLGGAEFYNGTNWVLLGVNYAAGYLLVAGGAGGGSGTASIDMGGGGGAGGVITGSTTLTFGITYSFVIGAGGASNTSGSNTTGFGLTAIGGGKGAGNNVAAGGTSGGSGGGGRGVASSIGLTGGSGTSGQGNAGGNGIGGAGSTPAYGAGGGGGAGAVGGNGSATNGGAGGVGISSSITGSAVFYGGGGGGGAGAYTGTGIAGVGGNGGGGAGGVTVVGTAGTANTGGGGGGSGSSTGTSPAGAAGGSGVGIIQIPTVYYTGIVTGSPTVTTVGTNTVIKFTSSGSYTA